MARRAGQAWSRFWSADRVSVEAALIETDIAARIGRRRAHIGIRLSNFGHTPVLVRGVYLEPCARREPLRSVEVIVACSSRGGDIAVSGGSSWQADPGAVCEVIVSWEERMHLEGDGALDFRCRLDVDGRQPAFYSSVLSLAPPSYASHQGT